MSTVAAGRLSMLHADHGGEYQVNWDLHSRNVGPRIEGYGRAEYATSSFSRSMADYLWMPIVANKMH